MQEGYDGRVKSVEGFSNGYTFKEAVPKHEETQDEGKNRLDQGMSMAFTYEKEGWRTWSFPEAASLWGCRTKALRIRS